MVTSVHLSTANVGGACLIAMLPQDILWKIFSINANMHNDKSHRMYSADKLDDWDTRALTTTWNCTHVCRQWRELVIGAASLWGNLIDLDAMAFIGPAWREEILARTGESALFVAGKIFGQKQPEREILIPIIKLHWRRIRFFRVSVTSTESFPLGTWDPFYFPTPALEVFHFRVSDDLPLRHNSETVDQQPLFANDAPRIHTISTWKLSSFLLPDLQWISQLRHLDMSYTRSMSISNWLQLLEKMPMLETVYLMFAIWPVPDLSWREDLPYVSLPCLEDLSISDDTTSCALLLDHITPKVGCVLSMYTPHTEPASPLEAPTVSLLSRVITRYALNWLKVKTLKSVALNILHQSIQFAECRRTRQHDPNIPIFETDLQCVRLQEFSLLLTLLRSYLPCDFSSVTSLDLFVELFHTQSLDDNVYDLFRAFSAVEELSFIQADTFQHFWRFVERKHAEEQDNGTILFPYLHTLKLVKGTTSSTMITLDTILAFVKYRKGVKASIRLIDLQLWTPIKELDLQYFEVFDGLKIVFQDETLGDVVREKICGKLW
ncbi:hypothetical protein D9613_007384 [Agrocybe pediades]|uniref:F-box domain-containing protein n=1 Tax=Agrocybe pediades TaxID=84607 RepID=A0A8H4VL88_9AGAR|nr:hypothetical protein D9613_007384 [Agrocybe pediades]